MKRIAIVLGIVLFILASYFGIMYHSLSPFVKEKERLLANELTGKGLKPNYMIISGYRPHWLNQLTPLAAKKSVHQVGQAIDIDVFDVNGDGKSNREDVELIVQTLEKMDRRNPALAGGIGTYFRSAPQMVHFDVAGKKRRWNY